MKVITVVVLICSASLLWAQSVCKRTVTDFGASSGDYIVKGSAVLTELNGTLTLSLSEDFYTDAGPDLHLYLAEKDEAPTQSTDNGITSTGNNHVEVKLLNSNAGSQSFVVPGSYKLSDFDYVLVHCKQYAHFWDGGRLGSVECETVSGLSSFTTEEILLYPNPTFGVVNIDLEGAIKATFFSLNGLKVLSTTAKQLDLSSLSSGVYMVQIEKDTGEIIRQMVTKK